MGSWISDARKRIYRNLKYRIMRPDPPAAPFRFNSPVVVVGSAPVSNRPAGLDESFRIITVNGSQSVIAKWGVDAPDITMMMFNQVEGTTANAIEVRRVLKGSVQGRSTYFSGARTIARAWRRVCERSITNTIDWKSSIDMSGWRCWIVWLTCAPSRWTPIQVLERYERGPFCPLQRSTCRHRHGNKSELKRSRLQFNGFDASSCSNGQSPRFQAD